jgi:hypothetical protein
LSLRFSDFNNLFERCRAKGQALSLAHFVFPEWKGRLRNRAVDLIVLLWIKSTDSDLVKLGADSLGILRRGKTRDLAKHIQDTSDSDSAGYLAYALGCIGVTENDLLATLTQLYSSNDQRLSNYASTALALSFPDLMATQPLKWQEQFFKDFVADSLAGSVRERTPYILLGLGRFKGELRQIMRDLALSDPLVRTAAALALARSERNNASLEVGEFSKNATSGSFEHLMGLAAMTSFDPSAADKLHQALCAVRPIVLWRLRHGVEPPGPRIGNTCLLRGESLPYQRGINRKAADKPSKSKSSCNEV